MKRPRPLSIVVDEQEGPFDLDNWVDRWVRTVLELEGIDVSRSRDRQERQETGLAS